MALHRPSLLIGAASAVGAVAVVLMLATPGFAITWPWNKPSNTAPVTVVVSGSVSCSSVTSLADGYGGSPALLNLSAGDDSQTVPYPFKLQNSRFGSIYRPPHFTGYWFKVKIPAKADKATVKWHLECRDQNGSPGSKDNNGEFTVGRKDLTRHICAHSSLTDPCTGPQIRDKAAECAFSVLTAGLGSDVLDLATAITDAMAGWTVQDYVLNAVGLASPVAGLIVACAPLVVNNANPVPTDKATTVAPLPTLTDQPPLPLKTTQAPPAGGQGGNNSGGTQPPPAPQPPHAVRPYDNYGAANAGRAMCRGNPGNSLSTPGGTASQTFTVPNGVSSIDHVLVQIDPDATVTGHLKVSVNGGLAATADAAAAGDTNFSFGAVRVSAGQTVTLALTFTATSGKIITVYTAGAPGGTFTASNSCPAGAPSLSTSATGLRAVVSGWS